MRLRGCKPLPFRNRVARWALVLVVKSTKNVLKDVVCSVVSCFMVLAIFVVVVMTWQLPNIVTLRFRVLSVIWMCRF